MLLHPLFGRKVYTLEHTDAQISLRLFCKGSPGFFSLDYYLFSTDVVNYFIIFSHLDCSRDHLQSSSKWAVVFSTVRPVT